MRLRRLVLITAGPLLGSLKVAALCPSACNGHGICTSSNTCVCFPGYSGFDCYARECPRATPWVDYSVGDDNMRSETRECANAGRCLRDSGKCECQAGFAGQACEKMIGPCNTNNCNGHGRCLSLQDVGAMRNDYNLLSAATYTLPWDAERIFGCVCDHGYTGADCSKRVCEYGDDPITTGQVDEVQALSCTCTSCSGTFTLTFRGETTNPIAITTATDGTLKTALESLLTIGSVTITLSTGGVGSPICSSTGVSALITFTHEHGDMPSLIVDDTYVTGGSHTISIQADGVSATFGGVTMSGTKEWLPCSGRGLCNSFNGICSCDSGFESSDGIGGKGDIPDCGYRSGGAMNKCPTNYGRECSGHGSCSGGTAYRCTCQNGYYGHDCSLRKCAQGRAWWEEPQANDLAHMNSAECSNAGICDQVGVCRCFPGFEGVACDRLSCPSNGDGVCSGRGRCKTARELAALTPTSSFGAAGFVYGTGLNSQVTWDADMIQGCHCNKVHWKRGQSVRYVGHDCSKVPCPRGDDPWTLGQVDEVQNVQCTASSGSFKLSFRGETTALIPSTSSPSALEFALESLRTISSVSVVYSVGSTVACAPGGNTIRVTFHSPSGDLPLLTVDASTLTYMGGTVSTSVTQLVQGTREDIVCNNRGRCDEDLGICICALHHASSDARGGYGTLADCGVVDAFMTHGEL